MEGLLWFVETSTYKIYLSITLSVITSWNVKAFDIWCGAPPHDLKLEYQHLSKVEVDEEMHEREDSFCHWQYSDADSI